MALITKDYFRDDINLPKSDLSDLDGYIRRFEEDVLIALLGYELYKAVILPANAEVSPYKEILEGAEYTVEYNGRDQLIKWPGLKPGSDNRSLIAYYVYVYYLKNKVTSYQTVGMVKSRQENSYNANVMGKIMAAWNEFEGLYGFAGQSVLVPSAYNFLLEKKDLIPEWVFTELKGNINGHDL